MACSNQHGPAAFRRFINQTTGIDISQSEWHELKRRAEAEGLDVSRKHLSEEDKFNVAGDISTAIWAERESAGDDSDLSQWDRILGADLEGVTVTQGTASIMEYLTKHGPAATLNSLREERTARQSRGRWTGGDFTVDVEGNRATIPAGKYWVGDPCYVVSDADWEPWLEDAKYQDNRLTLYGKTPNGVPVLGFSTQYGDGTYHDEDGNEYGVDAGLIGVVPFDYAPDYDGNLSRLVEFGEPVTCEIDMDGEGFRQGDRHTLVFGGVRIETGDYDPDADNDECPNCGASGGNADFDGCDFCRVEDGEDD